LLTIAAFFASGLALSCYGKDMTEAQVLAIAKRAAGAHCSTENPCTFKATREGSGWHVFVEFTVRGNPGGTPLPYPDGGEMIILDNSGTVLSILPAQ
jgi:hypothetical protein